MVRVQLSKADIVWPGVCPCCLGPADTVTFLIDVDTRRGKRLVRTTSRRWQAPYCSACVLHVKLSAEMEGCETNNEHYSLQSTAAAYRSALLAACIGTALIAAAVFMVQFDWNYWTGVGAVLCLVAAFASFAGAWRRVRERRSALKDVPAQHARAVELRARAAELRARPEAHPHDGCCTADWAVSYFFRSDSALHEFAFANSAYAKRFVESNPTAQIASGSI
jgi:hypothetical protein